MLYIILISIPAIYFNAYIIVHRERPVPKPRTRLSIKNPSTSLHPQNTTPQPVSDTSMSMYVSPTRSDDNTAIPVTAASSASAMLDTASSVDTPTNECDHGLKALREKRLLLKQQREQSQVQCKEVAIGEIGDKPSVPTVVANESTSDYMYSDPANVKELSNGINCPHCGSKLPLGLKSCYRCYQPVVQLKSWTTSPHDFVHSTVSDNKSPEKRNEFSKTNLDISLPSPQYGSEEPSPVFQEAFVPKVRRFRVIVY